MVRRILAAPAMALLAGAALAQAPAAPVLAQTPDPAHLSLVAGYKAGFTCSGVFNANQSVEDIARDDLVRIYRDYREAMAASAAVVIDRKAKTVSVPYAEGVPPRIAMWRPLLGCVQLPSGADFAMAGNIPGVGLETPKPDRRKLWPEGEKVTPASNKALDQLIASAFDATTYGEGTETTAVVIVKDGRIIAEKYRKGFDAMTPQRTWSAAKSITATIIGAAVQDGLIAIDDPAGLAQWSAPGDPRAAISYRHLLNMASGLDSSPAGNRTDDVYHGGGLVVDHATTRRLIAAPGSRWYYANNDTMLLMRALRERMNDDAAALRYPFEKLVLPLGMSRTFLETDWDGDFVLSSQVWTTGRDLARLGLLYLNDGVWNGTRIIPEDWNEFVARPAPVQPPLAGADGSPRAGYGAQFWLFDSRFGLPDGVYAAQGNRGQYLMIIPERNMLVVRRGFDDGGGFDIARFTKDVLAAAEQL